MIFRKLKKTAGGLLTLAVISCCLISGTLAKYTTTVEASDSARVAKFDVKPGTDDFKFNLFDTIYDTKSNGWTLLDLETDVWSKQKDQVIAPGTRGRFRIDLQNNSEVSVSYEVKFEEVNPNGIPLEYSLNGRNWVSDISELKAQGNFTIVNSWLPQSETIYWRWPFVISDEGDAADTELGLSGTATIEVKGIVTFTQID